MSIKLWITSKHTVSLVIGEVKVWLVKASIEQHEKWFSHLCHLLSSHQLWRRPCSRYSTEESKGPEVVHSWLEFTTAVCAFSNFILQLEEPMVSAFKAVSWCESPWCKNRNFLKSLDSDGNRCDCESSRNWAGGRLWWRLRHRAASRLWLLEGCPLLEAQRLCSHRELRRITKARKTDW